MRQQLTITALSYAECWLGGHGWPSAFGFLPVTTGRNQPASWKKGPASTGPRGM